MADGADEQGISVEACALLLGVSTKTIARMIKAGDLISMKVRKRRIIVKSSALAKLRQGRDAT